MPPPRVFAGRLLECQILRTVPHDQVAHRRVDVLAVKERARRDLERSFERDRVGRKPARLEHRQVQILERSDKSHVERIARDAPLRPRDARRSAIAGCRFSDCAQPTEGNTPAIRKQPIASRIPRPRESGTLRESGSGNSNAIVTILCRSQIQRHGRLNRPEILAADRNPCQDSFYSVRCSLIRSKCGGT